MALEKVRSECVKLGERALFHLHHPKVIPLLDFVQVRCHWTTIVCCTGGPELGQARYL